MTRGHAIDVMEHPAPRRGASTTDDLVSSASQADEVTDESSIFPSFVPFSFLVFTREISSCLSTREGLFCVDSHAGHLCTRVHHVQIFGPANLATLPPILALKRKLQMALSTTMEE
ncbi:hypothetical protein D9613_004462 [Agrocybe pediades]|uniref:Uncharacterized protein n=1 Tax=Agrocybe pediades TaxID=84607 RepID=A0A8H4VJK6_9AGAR|nr:hypothetical protein D9613_004462 [Agrocybe pediades]